jgi:hypothetical protein
MVQSQTLWLLVEISKSLLLLATGISTSILYYTLYHLSFITCNKQVLEQFPGPKPPLTCPLLNFIVVSVDNYLTINIINQESHGHQTNVNDGRYKTEDNRGAFQHGYSFDRLISPESFE